MPLTSRDLHDIARARHHLEHPSLAVRVADYVGRPVEGLVKRLPDGARQLVAAGTQKGLSAALDVALRTLDARPRAVSHAAEYVAERGLSPYAKTARHSMTDKAAAQLVPILGAAGGAAINALFIDHYQDTAWAHFTLRRLERTHGPAAVRAAYEARARANDPD